MQNAEGGAWTDGEQSLLGRSDRGRNSRTAQTAMVSGDNGAAGKRTKRTVIRHERIRAEFDAVRERNLKQEVDVEVDRRIVKRYCLCSNLRKKRRDRIEGRYRTAKRLIWRRLYENLLSRRVLYVRGFRLYKRFEHG